MPGDLRQLCAIEKFFQLLVHVCSTLLVFLDYTMVKKFQPKPGHVDILKFKSDNKRVETATHIHLTPALDAVLIEFMKSPFYDKLAMPSPCKYRVVAS